MAGRARRILSVESCLESRNSNLSTGLGTPLC